MGAAAIPIAMGVGSFAAAKFSGADTRTALGAGLLGGVGGWAAGPALGAGGILGAASTGAGLGSQIGGAAAGGAAGGTQVVPAGAITTPNPVFATGSGPSNAVSGAGGGFAPQSRTDQPASVEKAKKTKDAQDALMTFGSMYQMSQSQKYAEMEAEAKRMQAEAQMLAAQYRPPPSPSLVGGAHMSFPTVGGGFATGR